MKSTRRGWFMVRILMFAMVFSVFGISDAAADRGWFAGLSFGQTKWNNYDAELAAAATTLDDSDTGWFAFSGYQVNNYFSAVAGYVDLGSLKAEGDLGEGYLFSDEISASGPVLAALGTVPITPKFSAFIMAGVFFWDQDIKYFDDFIGPWNGGVSGTGMMYGAGFNFFIDPAGSSGIHAEWMRFDAVGDLNDPESTHENDIDMISIGYIYRWGT